MVMLNGIPNKKKKQSVYMGIYTMHWPEHIWSGIIIVNDGKNMLLLLTTIALNGGCCTLLNC